jgi:hypothetical protein
LATGEEIAQRQEEEIGERFLKDRDKLFFRNHPALRAQYYFFALSHFYWQFHVKNCRSPRADGDMICA